MNSELRNSLLFYGSLRFAREDGRKSFAFSSVDDSFAVVFASLSEAVQEFRNPEK